MNAPARHPPAHMHAASTSAIMNQTREEKHQHQQSQSISQPPLERSTGITGPIQSQDDIRSESESQSQCGIEQSKLCVLVRGDGYIRAETSDRCPGFGETIEAALNPLLNEQGYPLGLRLLDLLLYRTLTTSSSSSSSTQSIRPLRIISLLQLIHGPLWRLLFSRPADALEHSVSPDTPNEYMITDNDPLTNMYISVPREMGLLNCAAFVAGIIEGVCDGCGFEAKVTAHNQGNEMWPSRTVFLVKFGESVMEREKMLERAGVK
ncbi:trafficking protein particle complex subunit 5 [Coccidioides immitis RMSCC 2394]|uniref:Trafficking protein particle complex subunit 5 n=1 Tax=Coccidioides immitis RMSCC 2394 TaxID=404692 RepID=A0A0J7BFF1_COCIT|nr:trafficking protein particle complex subunit 5 [Coccidioides immitis RMSCC 2394]